MPGEGRGHRSQSQSPLPTRAGFHFAKTPSAQGPKKVGASRQPQPLCSPPSPPPLLRSISERGAQSARRGCSLRLARVGAFPLPPTRTEPRQPRAVRLRAEKRGRPPSPRRLRLGLEGRHPLVLLTPQLRSSPSWAAATAAVAAASRSPNARTWGGAMLCAPRTGARGARGGPGARGRTRGQSRPPGARWPAGRRETWDARVRVGRTTARCPGARSTVRAGRRAARFGRSAGRSRPSRPGGPAPGPCPRLLTSAGQFSALSHRREAGGGNRLPPLPHSERGLWEYHPLPRCAPGSPGACSCGRWGRGGWEPGWPRRKFENTDTSFLPEGARL